jgi:hypothetical protein
MSIYTCPVCGETVDSKIIHDHYLDKLESILNKVGYKTIREGKFPNLSDEWKEPDLFIFSNRVLIGILDVVVTDVYEGNTSNSVIAKVIKIKDYFNMGTIIFEPVKYFDSNWQDRFQYYSKKIGQDITSYSQIEKYYTKKWEKQGLTVHFVNENILTEEWCARFFSKKKIGNI